MASRIFRRWGESARASKQLDVTSGPLAGCSCSKTDLRRVGPMVLQAASNLEKWKKTQILTTQSNCFNDTIILFKV